MAFLKLTGTGNSGTVLVCVTKIDAVATPNLTDTYGALIIIGREAYKVDETVEQIQMMLGLYADVGFKCADDLRPPYNVVPFKAPTPPGNLPPT